MTCFARLTNRIKRSVVKFFRPQLEEFFVSQSLFKEKFAGLKSSVDSAISRAMSEVDALNAKVADLEAHAVSDEDLSELDALKAKIDAINPTHPAVLTPPAPKPVELPPAPLEPPVASK